MKILYALQCTGNGHIARAQELLPILEKYAEVDLLASGHQSQILLPKIPRYNFRGISLLYNRKGGLSYWKTAFRNNFPLALKNIYQLPLDEYDLILNDFEPISAWACKWKGIQCIGIGHQAAMLFPETPKPKKKSLPGELVLRFYAPTTEKTGFHFQRYNKHIQLPVIRSKIRNLNPTDSGHYVVYLPSYSDEFLKEKLRKIPVLWQVFSKYAKGPRIYGNVEIFPIDEKNFLQKFESCTGILCNAGFETPAEALFLNKKLFVIPIKNQYEQECNAVALQQMGIAVSTRFDLEKIIVWINSKKRIKMEFPDNMEEIILHKIFKNVNDNDRQPVTVLT
ncbi:MAG: glycosyl transferase [Flavobacteriaceae bacterium]|jgi:uncharacterized protein (TIGR00661 family)|nr:glycosyl transferase [Flavobacteriaceae bacterium]